MAIALGVAVGLALELDDAATATMAAPTSIHDASPTVDPDALARVQSLHDEARALTPAQVALDERAHERWLPRVADIEAALADPHTPESIRVELVATIEALECVGVLEPPGDAGSCATMAR